MEQENKYIDDWITTYLTREMDSNSLDKLKKWIAESPENEKYFMQRQEIWFSAIDEEERTIYNKEKAFDQFCERISRQKVTGKTTGSKKNLRLSMIWRYAAVALVLLAVSYFSYWQGGVQVKDNFAEMVVESPLGSKTKLYLPDGSSVWLNGGSRIEYSQGFGVDNRRVNLMGEGYFEVVRNEKVPFFVNTNDLQVKVLGTKFNFRNYKDDDEVVVTLLQGKVALNNLLRKEKEMYLSPNERVVLNKKDGRMQIESIAAANASEWTNGYLFFDEELLPDIAKELERSYNVKIQITSDSLKTFRFYGNFVRREQTIHEVLEALSSTGKIHYTIDEQQIILY